MQKESWKAKGFKTKEEYTQFMHQKIEDVFKMIKDDPELIAWSKVYLKLKLPRLK